MIAATYRELKVSVAREAHSVVPLIRPRFALWTSLARILPNFALVSLRAMLHRWAGCDIARDVAMQGSPHLLGRGEIAGRLHIGEASVLAPNITFGLDADVTVGRNVSIGPGVTIHTATHAIGYGSRRMAHGTIGRPITIEDGVWIGMHSIILPGVTVGRGSVVSAGSVVFEDVTPNTLVAGNPAAFVERLPFSRR